MVELSSYVMVIQSKFVSFFFFKKKTGYDMIRCLVWSDMSIIYKI